MSGVLKLEVRDAPRFIRARASSIWARADTEAELQTVADPQDPTELAVNDDFACHHIGTKLSRGSDRQPMALKGDPSLDRTVDQ